MGWGVVSRKPHTHACMNARTHVLCDVEEHPRVPCSCRHFMLRHFVRAALSLSRTRSRAVTTSALGGMDHVMLLLRCSKASCLVPDFTTRIYSQLCATFYVSIFSLQTFISKLPCFSGNSSGDKLFRVMFGRNDVLLLKSFLVKVSPFTNNSNGNVRMSARAVLYICTSISCVHFARK